MKRPGHRCDRFLLCLPWAVLLAGVLCPDRSFGQGYAPQEAVAKMTLSTGLDATLFASEPEVRQPILVKCDDQGRLWTIQYLQYPNPAGLKRVKVDRWSRTVYDQIPEPPPRGPEGADRITILEDKDGDGRAEQIQDFVTGLNLTTGLEFGDGGVYVIQVPYLLFYPDEDRDDVPDGDPRVVLEGFGMEDAQSLANHLTWGPDGWLYGLNGSTTTCRIRGIEFQQGVWRYHPPTDRFELFCEGGGNPFGLTFDDNGNLFYSSNGGLCYHALQGAYFEKNFGKHGPLHNPYAYGWFSHVENSGVYGRPTTGGTIYLGDSLPERFRGAFLCGDFLTHTCSWWHFEPKGATFTATHAGLLLDSHDTWFGPTDLCFGPDGAVYVCDFHDQRTAHPDPDANWDRSNGRIFRLQAQGTGTAERIDLHRLSSEQIVDLLRQSNRWLSQRARVILAHRRDQSILARLEEMARQQEDSHLALEGLWALHGVAGLSDEIAEQLLEHPYEYVRSWTVRLLGDERNVSTPVADKLIDLARSESSPIVRCQLAATAKRLPAGTGLAIVRHLLEREPNSNDPHAEWLLWWAIESKAMSGRDLLLGQFTRPGVWDQPSYRGHVRRLLRRYAAEGTAESYAACLRLLEATPGNQLGTMHAALARGLAERARGPQEIGQGGLFEEFAIPGSSSDDASPRGASGDPLPSDLKAYITRHWKQNRTDAFWLEMALRAEIPDAESSLLEQVAAPNVETERRTALLKLAGEFGGAGAGTAVLRLFTDEQPETVQAAVLRALNRLGAVGLSERILDRYPQLPRGLQSQAREVLLGRPESALALLKAVDAGQIKAEELPLEQLQLASVHGSQEIDALVREHWGNIEPGTPEEKLATIRRFMNDLRAGSGDRSHGRALFLKHCGTCHQLFGEGNEIGPDLTGTSRGDVSVLLANIVDPSAVVRREYLNYVVVTDSGLVLTGLMAEHDAGSITILDAKNRRVAIPRDEIVEFRESPLSLMPERLLEQLTPQERRDLIAYLQKGK